MPLYPEPLQITWDAFAGEWVHPKPPPPTPVCGCGAKKTYKVADYAIGHAAYCDVRKK